MADVGFCVIAEHMRADDALELRIEMGKEVRMAEQHPIEKQNIIDFHAAEHDEEAREKLCKAEFVSQPIPYAEERRAEEQQHRDRFDRSADDARAAEPMLLIGDRGEVFLRRGAEKALILNKAHRAVQNEKIRKHDDADCDDGDFHLRRPRIYITTDIFPLPFPVRAIRDNPRRSHRRRPSDRG